MICGALRIEGGVGNDQRSIYTLLKKKGGTKSNQTLTGRRSQLSAQPPTHLSVVPFTLSKLIFEGTLIQGATSIVYFTSTACPEPTNLICIPPAVTTLSESKMSVRNAKPSSDIA